MSFVHAPNVECALGKHVMVQNAMRIGFESAVAERVKELGANGFTSADEMAEWTGKMLLLSGGKNSIKWTDDGGDPKKYWPSVVVWRPAHKASYYLEGAGDNFHPAFKAGANMYPGYWAGKYGGPYVTSNSKTLLLSLPNFDGKVNVLTGAQVDTNYDTSVTYGTAGGNGSHSITNAEWMEIALDCYNSGFQPKGNNQQGRDSGDPDTPEYYGVPSYWSSGGNIMRVLNGSGPLSWFHDGSPWGVWGMNGNFSEITTGLRLKAGEIQVLANNDAALYDCDHGDAAGQWKGILQDGNLVDPGADGTLKYDALDAITISTSVTTRTTATKNHTFGTVAAADGVTIPKIAQLLGIAPIGTAAQHGGDYIYIRNDADGAFSETVARRGGRWRGYTQGGVFVLSLSYTRHETHINYGSRLAFL